MDIRGFHCESCDITFFSRTSQDNHKTIHHRGHVRLGAALTCTYCKQTYESQQYLRAHEEKRKCSSLTGCFKLMMSLQDRAKAKAWYCEEHEIVFFNQKDLYHHRLSSHAAKDLEKNGKGFRSQFQVSLVNGGYPPKKPDNVNGALQATRASSELSTGDVPRKIETSKQERRSLRIDTQHGSPRLASGSVSHVWDDEHYPSHAELITRSDDSLERTGVQARTQQHRVSSAQNPQIGPGNRGVSPSSSRLNPAIQRSPLPLKLESQLQPITYISPLSKPGEGLSIGRLEWEQAPAQLPSPKEVSAQQASDAAIELSSSQLSHRVETTTRPIVLNKTKDPRVSGKLSNSTGTGPGILSLPATTSSYQVSPCNLDQQPVPRRETNSEYVLNSGSAKSEAVEPVSVSRRDMPETRDDPPRRPLTTLTPTSTVQSATPASRLRDSPSRQRSPVIRAPTRATGLQAPGLDRKHLSSGLKRSLVADSESEDELSLLG